MVNKTLTRSLFLIFAALLFTACSLSTEQLADEVKKDMANNAEFKSRGVTVKEFTLVHKSGNDYEGLLVATESNGEFTYKVDVTYDGSKLTWKLAEQVTQ
ncbi:MAG: hypothetical protein IPJ75_09485 [Ignavibacteriales bacterium]|nr:hypothetical protein [Ignavibacteriales bacterium]